MRPPSPDAIAAIASRIAFGKPIVQNNLRALVVEVIVGAALGSAWQHCSGDWRGWDFEHETGVRLEVKQSARQQTWMTASDSRYLPRFDVRERTGYWERGTTWMPRRGRHAQIYVFAYHDIIGAAADHRDPLQWQFHVVQTTRLPNVQTVSLSTLAKFSQPVGWGDLLDVVERKRCALPSP